MEQAWTPIICEGRNFLPYPTRFLTFLFLSCPTVEITLTQNQKIITRKLQTIFLKKVRHPAISAGATTTHLFYFKIDWKYDFLISIFLNHVSVWEKFLEIVVGIHLKIGQFKNKMVVLEGIYIMILNVSSKTHPIGWAWFFFFLLNRLTSTKTD